MQLTRIGNYDIIKPLGSGGTARVFLAKDRDLKRVVALKLLHPHLAMDQDYLDRFRREAITSANLDHPNIINVFTFDHDDDNHYMTIEYVDGFPLNDFLQKHRLKYPQIGLMITYLIADAIGYAHQNKVIHRDIKPENIMISSEGDLKVTDFGIAKIVTEKTLTVTGSLMGSPAYMSPEQALGKPVQQQSDIFSLGTLLYYLVTGKLPFYGNSPTLILKKVIDAQYEQPSRFNPLIDRPIEHLFQLLLEGDAQKRIQNLDLVKIYILDILKSEGINNPIEELKSFFKNPEEYQQELQKRLVISYRDLAIVYYKKHQILKALRYCSKVLVLAPDDQKMQQLLRKLNLINHGNRLWYILLYCTIISLFSMVVFKKTFENSDPPKSINPITRSSILNDPFNREYSKLHEALEERWYLTQILHKDGKQEIIKKPKKKMIKIANIPKTTIQKRIRRVRRKPRKAKVPEYIPVTIHKKKDPKVESVIAIKPTLTAFYGKLHYCFRPYAEVSLDGVKQSKSCLTHPMKIKKGSHRLTAIYRFGKQLEWRRHFTVNQEQPNIRFRHNFQRYSTIYFALKSRSVPEITLKDRSGNIIDALLSGGKKISINGLAAGKYRYFMIPPGRYYLSLTDGDITYQNLPVAFTKKGTYRVSMDLNHDENITVNHY